MNPVTPDPEILPFKEYVAIRAYDYYIIILCASINMASLPHLVVYTFLCIVSP